jgi:hypothetical protein
MADFKTELERWKAMAEAENARAVFGRNRKINAFMERQEWGRVGAEAKEEVERNQSKRKTA